MGENIVARILFIIGIAQMAIGILVGLILGNQEYNGSVMNWSVFFTWTIGGFILGMLFIGFAENIRLLHSINKKMLESPVDVQQSEIEIDSDWNEPDESLATGENDVNSDATASWKLDESDREAIKRFYGGTEISEIVASPYEGYCLVKLKNEEGYFVRVVDTNGYGVQEVQDVELKHRIIKWYNDVG